ncbi:glycine, alanine and asparagine-rich protein-like [Pecten maximus]|uniref:glycine, alanine and asparagine-rich protein-like n=1 Tax=Pecten maximus TaxID=6579 RepID=UPI00145889AB|nr:glycine, alanine and asparagine-rich protein-like [Pecten maximus]
MQQSLVNLFFSFVCGVTVVSAFHLQSDPSQIARVCTGRINQICQSAGMRCRANQAFDADIPHAVCDRLNGRTRGVRPAALLARQGRMRQQRMGGQFGGMAGNVGRVRGFGRGANGLALNGQTFGGRLGRGMGNGLAGGLGGGMTGGMTRGMNGGNERRADRRARYEGWYGNEWT